MHDEPKRPADDDRDAWRQYWAKVQPPEWFERWGYWRTEPEIDEQRQEYLIQRRAVVPDIPRGIYPFRDENGPIRLTRADVEWLLSTHESGRMTGPVDWDNEQQRARAGLDLRGADVHDVDLHGFPLSRMRGGLTRAERIGMRPLQRAMAGAHFEMANLSEAHLHGVLASARLEGADLYRARLERSTLNRAHLESANLFEARLDGTNLRYAFFDEASSLSGVQLSSNAHGTAQLYGVHWRGADLSEVDWAHVSILGEEESARRRTLVNGKRKDARKQLADYVEAVRANRQLATALRLQGLNEDADRFAYRAQFLQRQVLRGQRRWLRYAGAVLLDIVAGYGYKPMRSVFTYVLVIALFAATYFSLGGSHGQALSWNEALVVSMTAFHGRGFFGSAFQPGDPQAAVAAVEALVGLLIEITFIATFTQRFFAR